MEDRGVTLLGSLHTVSILRTAGGRVIDTEPQVLFVESGDRRERWKEVAAQVLGWSETSDSPQQKLLMLIPLFI